MTVTREGCKEKIEFNLERRLFKLQVTHTPENTQISFLHPETLESMRDMPSIFLSKEGVTGFEMLLALPIYPTNGAVAFPTENPPILIRDVPNA